MDELDEALDFDFAGEQLSDEEFDAATSGSQSNTDYWIIAHIVLLALFVYFRHKAKKSGWKIVWTIFCVEQVLLIAYLFYTKEQE